MGYFGNVASDHHRWWHDDHHHSSAMVLCINDGGCAQLRLTHPIGVKVGKWWGRRSQAAVDGEKRVEREKSGVATVLLGVEVFRFFSEALSGQVGGVAYHVTV